MEDKHKEEECLSNGPLIDFSSVSDSRAHLSGDVPDSDRIPVNSEKMQPIANIGTADLSVNDDATDVSVVTNDHDTYLPAKPDLDEDIYKSFEITNVEEKCEILISQPITHKGNKRMIQKSIDELDMLLASTYVQEAYHGRNGYFVPERHKLRIYYWYNNPFVRLGLFLLIWVNLSLVLFEEPAVYPIPYWGTMLIEIVCLCGFFGRLAHGWAYMPKWRHWKDRKILIILCCLMITLVDMGVYVILKQTGNSAYALRWSRILRPAFMINFSESRQIRRAIRNIRRTLPEIANVLVLLLLVIALYALLGLKLFQRRGLKMPNGQPYFTNYWDNYFNLYVLTTTANNPDITIPAYNKNNWFSLFFVVFLVVCMYIFVSIFLAVVYKNFRKNLKNEVKAVVYRRRRNLRAAFDCIKVQQHGKQVITFGRWKTLLHYMAPKMSPVQAALMWHVLDEGNTGMLQFKDFTYIVDMLSVKMVEVKERPQFFERLCPRFFNSRVSQFVRKCVQHRAFVYFFDVVIVANAICIGFGIDEGEIAFLVLFNIEIILKIYTYGFKEFFTKFWNIFDFAVIEAATFGFITEATFEPLRFSEGILDLLLVLRVLRLFKIIGNIKRFQVIINTILQIGPAILTYGGIMFILYYVYAIIGMEAFGNKIKDGIYPKNTTGVDPSLLYCGDEKLRGSDFHRLHYCGKNFNDILKAFTLCFDLTVVNQWHVITDGFVRVTSKAARIYFLCFHLLCVIVVLNIFVAFILEAFMLQYSFSKTEYEAALERKIEEKGAGVGLSVIFDGSKHFGNGAELIEDGPVGRTYL